MSETREIAERLVLDALNGRVIKQVNAFVKEDYQRLAIAIDAALVERDERAVEIAEAHKGHGKWCSDKGDCQTLTIEAIIVAIKQGSTDAK